MDLLTLLHLITRTTLHHGIIRKAFPPGDKVTFTGKEVICTRCLNIRPPSSSRVHTATTSSRFSPSPTPDKDASKLVSTSKTTSSLSITRHEETTRSKREEIIYNNHHYQEVPRQQERSDPRQQERSDPRQQERSDPRQQERSDPRQQERSDPRQQSRNQHQQPEQEVGKSSRNRGQMQEQQRSFDSERTISIESRSAVDRKQQGQRHGEDLRPRYSRNANQCPECDEVVQDGEALVALDRQWHVWCFKCTDCQQVLEGEYMGKDGLPYCERDYQKSFGVRCIHCDRYITGKVLQAGDNHHFHPTCARCTKCGDPFGDGEEMFMQGGAIWHPRCGPGSRAGDRGRRYYRIPPTPSTDHDINIIDNSSQVSFFLPSLPPFLFLF